MRGDLAREIAPIYRKIGGRIIPFCARHRDIFGSAVVHVCVAICRVDLCGCGEYTCSLARSRDRSGAWQACAGSLEVREFFVPGWNQTQTESCGGKKCPGKKWPAYSRVNHAKYIVSDGRLNVGTSNWQWGYFHNTAGLSFNTDGAALVATAQAIFDADWASAYAVPLAT